MAGCIEDVPIPSLPKYDIVGYKHFTAIVSARPEDLNKPVRQMTSIRALNTIVNLAVIRGSFMTRPVRLPLAKPRLDQPRFVEVMRTEEKDSDVNRAIHLLNDAYQDRYDVGVVVSNDSDLVEPVRLVQSEVGKTVGIINPHQKSSQLLVKHATFTKLIRPSVLAASQFPDVMHDRHGEFHKRVGW